MTSGPDVTPIGFAATDAPGALVRRRRSPGWLVLGILLVGIGGAGIVWFVAAQLGNAPARESAVATGRLAALGGPPTPAVRFSGQGDYTVWLETSGVTLSDTRELIIAATDCVATFADGASPARLRGARQGASVTVGDRSTLGTFTAPAGDIAVRCSQRPFGRRGRQRALAAERTYFVAARRPGVGWRSWVGMFGGIGLIVLSVPVLGRYRAGYLRPR